MSIETWNVRSINCKKNELIQEFKRYKIETLAITKIKKKRTEEIIANEPGLLYSGVEMNKRVRQGKIV